MQVKFFIGYPLTAELRAFAHDKLLQVVHKSKEYVGLYLDSSSPTIVEIRKSAAQLKSILSMHVQGDPLVFPQCFVG
ncbi:MAG: hypothetical protein K940chlam2_01538 [Chlamydiae bacterium]|nr:hypothetical protein [Chlamydiota bacterium]